MLYSIGSGIAETFIWKVYLCIPFFFTYTSTSQGVFPVNDILCGLIIVYTFHAYENVYV